MSYPHDADHTALHRSIWIGAQPVSEAKKTNASTLRRVRRGMRFLLVWTLTWIAVGVVYAKIFYPDYIATTQVVLQPRLIVNDGPEDVRHFHQVMIDSEQCETELRIIRSEPLLYRVFDALNLIDSPEMRNGPDGFWAYLGTKIDQVKRIIAPAPGQASQGAFWAFTERVRARRLGLSYVIEISYRAQDATRAAHVVNSIASAYAVHRLKGALIREQQRDAYLERRPAKLRAQMKSAELAMQLGSIPAETLVDANIRLLGPANLPTDIVYPKMIPVLLLAACIGGITGILIVLMPNTADESQGGHLAYSVRSDENARIA